MNAMVGLQWLPFLLAGLSAEFWNFDLDYFSHARKTVLNLENVRQISVEQTVIKLWIQIVTKIASYWNFLYFFQYCTVTVQYCCSVSREKQDQVFLSSLAEWAQNSNFITCTTIGSWLGGSKVRTIGLEPAINQF